MDGSSQRKWQNLKFAEISVWRRVSDLFFMLCFGRVGFVFFPLFSPTWTQIRGVVHTFLWVPADFYADMLKAMRNFKPTLPLAEKRQDLIEYIFNLH